MIFGREALSKPGRQTRGDPSVQIQHRVLRYVLTHAVPVQRGFATHMQAIELTLEQEETRIQG